MTPDQIEAGKIYRSYPIGRYGASDRKVVAIETAGTTAKVRYRVVRKGLYSKREYWKPLARFAETSRCLKEMSQIVSRETFATRATQGPA